MNQSICKAFILAAGLFPCLPTARAQFLDQIGVTLLRATTTNLDGSGIRVAQPETYNNGTTNWEVNPGFVGQPVSRFTYASDAGVSATYPNALSPASDHANDVGNNFYGMNHGVATNVAQVDNFEANYFVDAYVVSNLFTLGAPVVNQSFTYGSQTSGTQQYLDSLFDDYSVSHQILLVSAACNFSISTRVSAPGTAYNCISVGAYGGDSSMGPTLDNGRCKPDLTAPASATSYSTPQVAGAAAILMQAALRGDGGGDTNAACDLRTVKALLLNGAVKPVDWTNSSTFPLDARYGAGVLNVFNAYRQLAGGKQNFTATNSVALDAVHPPTTATNSIPAHAGWSFGSLASSPTSDAVWHYLFHVTNTMASVTVVWNRQFGAAGVNDLDLFLYDCANSNLIAGSISYVNNVEHLWVTNLPAGRYDLQIVKYGGTNVVSDAETFALAWQFVQPPALALTKAGTNLNLTWPFYPAGFVAEANTNLLSPGSWSTNQLLAVMFTNGQNTLVLQPTNAAKFFRLRQR